MTARRPRERDNGRTAVLERFAAALAETTIAVTLRRGQLVVDQRRIAHGRTAQGHQLEALIGSPFRSPNCASMSKPASARNALSATTSRKRRLARSMRSTVPSGAAVVP
ncbi:hypothetical protein [Streptomyces sp. NPDC058092]|uniref:hypothetical protein n=1 Tax=Streptomyces sp. NPDC058092 TaxID=3346336 RepID=UPI0036E57ADA